MKNLLKITRNKAQASRKTRIFFLQKKRVKMDSFENSENRVSFEFEGGVWEWFVWALLILIGFIFVIPSPWITVGFYRWFVSKVKLSDQTQMSFSGEVRQIWFPIIAITALPYLGEYLDYSYLVILPLDCILSLIIIRWFCLHLVFSCGSRITFEGNYLPYLGWNVLINILFLTIVGWAWASAGMIKWIFQNIKSDNLIVKFQGDGWNILWRTFTFVFCCLLIFPIPWISLWLVKWYVSSISIERIEPTSM